MTLTVVSNIAYHYCQKGISGQVNPVVSLLATYHTALVLTLIASFFVGAGGEGMWTAAAWSRLNWASFALGFAAAGLELGFLLVYRAGWKLSMAAIYSNVVVTHFR